ncbi:MAG: sigma-54-dependent Fis family transcriptional regulator [Planctomyces sp.]|nr:sigma-54-dependent Fis family transcriptional regulator [Planctomyces sp.]
MPVMSHEIRDELRSRRVLIVDDEASICWALSEALKDEGLQVDIASSAEEATRIVQSSPPDVVILDVRLPGKDGLTAFADWKSAGLEIPVIVMTAFGNLSVAVQAIERGAFDYLVKPLDLDSAVTLIKSAVQTRIDLQKNYGTTRAAETRHSTTETAQPELIIGSSPAMQSIYRRIAMVAERNVPVLITGESGTGKDLVARAIHAHSRRSGQFVTVCIPAFSESLVESELFGHVRGAFTGADQDRRGLLAMADQGTAFIDEIGDVSPAVQVKLLRVLETRAIQPVGGRNEVISDFRLIAATHRNLSESVATGKFREDLFYRLNVFQIHLPPLRERRTDIMELAEYFLGRIRGPQSQRFSEDVASCLESREWRGNIRELRHAVEAAAVLCRGGVITPEHFESARLETAPPGASWAEAFPSEGIGGNQNHQSLAQAEPDVRTLNLEQKMQQAVRAWVHDQINRAPDREANSERGLWDQFLTLVEPPVLETAIEANEGNRAMAARLLGIHRETLRDRLRKYGQSQPE